MYPRGQAVVAVAVAVALWPECIENHIEEILNHIPEIPSHTEVPPQDVVAPPVSLAECHGRSSSPIH